MRLSTHSLANEDLRRAVLYYLGEASPAVAVRFMAEYNRVVRLLLEHPRAGTLRNKGRRGFPLDGFPYSVIYREVPDGIRVVVVKHHSQRPNYGDRRR
ncbi:MAG: type II toxin-antitoxin system RelE/ParE family toxin [Pseudoxanthomonas sp.]